MRSRFALLVVVAAATTAAAGRRTAITVWSGVSATQASVGGAGYGAVTPTTGALVTEQREVDVDASGEVRIAGVATTIDPASVRLRSLTDPDLTVTQQRYLAGATTPSEILARHVGDTITVITAKGDVTGVLRAVEPQALVVEVGIGDRRHLQVMHRDGYVLDVKLPSTAGADQSTLAWHVATKKPGKHVVELTYRASELAWTADYTAILDDSGKSIDFSAWATLKNGTGASFDDAEVTLVSGGGQLGPAAYNGYQALARPPLASPTRYVIPTRVRLGASESVQVELLPPRTRAKARAVVVFEALPDPALDPTYAQSAVVPDVDCNKWNGGGGASARVEAAVELEVANSAQLPEGRVRAFRRRAGKDGERLELASEDQLRTGAGVARISLASDAEITGERHATPCVVDEHARTLREKVELRLDNKSKHAVDVVVREFMRRWQLWKIDPADESPHGSRAGAQTQEYCVSVPAGGKQVVTYTVLYSW